MVSPDQPNSELLKTVLEPLLEDFQYWFNRARNLLETETIEFLGAENQAALLERVKQAQQEVGVAQTLLNLTEGQVGVETAVLIPWHDLVTECWKVAIKFRMQDSQGLGLQS